MNDRGPLDLALRALRDCGVIRCMPSHDGMTLAVRRGLAETATRRVGDRWMWDVRLTAAGRRATDQLKPWTETRR